MLKMDNLTINPLSDNMTLSGLEFTTDINPDDAWRNVTEPTNTNVLNASTTNTYTDYSFPEPYFTISQISVWLIIPLVIASLIGNTLIIIVMRMPKNRNSSTSVFFIGLAVSDMFIALFVALERWLIRAYNINIYVIDANLSIIKLSILYANIELSSWILLFITVERVCSIAFPYSVKEVCTKKLAQAVLIIAIIVFIAFNALQFTQFVTLYIDKYNNLEMDSKIVNGSMVIHWIDFTFTFFIPLAVISFGSIFILIHLARVTIQKHDQKAHRNRSVTRTLLAANIVFIVTMSPYLMLKLLFPIIYNDDTAHLYWTLADVFMFLSDVNCALNFFVYVLSGARFRADVMGLIMRCHKKTAIKRPSEIPSASYKHESSVSDSTTLPSTSESQ